MNNLIDLPLVRTAIRQYPWDHEARARGQIPFFTEAEADERAGILVKDMRKIGCTWPVRGQPIDEQRTVGIYEVPDTDFGEMNKETVPEVQKVEGLGLTWGCIVRLSKACVLARRFFGPNWTATKIGRGLMNGTDHFSLIEEILWLGPWHGVSHVQYEEKPFAAAGGTKPIDLRFDSCGQKINLEVKYRPRDWARFVDGEKFNTVMPSYFDDVQGKFPTRNLNELNLVGVTVPALIDKSWRITAENLLQGMPTLDGVVVWVCPPGYQPSYEIHSTKKELIELFFKGGDAEDLSYRGFTRFVQRKPEERRAYRASEAASVIARIAEEEWGTNK